jgi:DNA-directed RNA polymerase specialized sigma24 family protein
MVWRYLRHFLGDPDLALDVTQETFVRVFAKLPYLPAFYAFEVSTLALYRASMIS